MAKRTPPTPIGEAAAQRPVPKIRSLPGQVLQLTKDDLQELRLRQQALMMTKATFLLSQSGYSVHINEILDKYGIDRDSIPKGQRWAVNLDTGEIARQMIGEGV